LTRRVVGLRSGATARAGVRSGGAGGRHASVTREVFVGRAVHCWRGRRGRRGGAAPMPGGRARRRCRGGLQVFGCPCGLRASAVDAGFAWRRPSCPDTCLASLLGQIDVLESSFEQLPMQNAKRAGSQGREAGNARNAMAWSGIVKRDRDTEATSYKVKARRLCHERLHRRWARPPACVLFRLFSSKGKNCSQTARPHQNTSNRVILLLHTIPSPPSCMTACRGPWLLGLGSH
jgi:hypothetical protein